MAIFRSVVDAGSFRAAATTLRLSPSVVSQHVSQLEDHLETALLYRSTRKISLTEAGADLLAASHKMVEAATEGIEAVQRRTDQMSGRLRIAVAGNLWETPPYVDHLVTFARQHPKVDLSISFSDQKVELIGSQFDIALRTGWLENSQYKSRKLFEIERVFIAAPSYLAGKTLPKRVEDLASWDWVKLIQLPLSKQLTSRSGETPDINPNIAVEVDSVAAMRNFVKGGIGVASVPRHMVKEDLHNGSLIALSPGWDLMSPGTYAVWPNNVSKDSLTRRFVQFLVERLT